MRTVILISGILIADAIDTTSKSDESVIASLAITLFVCIAMDIIEFIKKIRK